MNIEQLDNVGVVAEGLEEDNFPKSALRISFVSKRIKYLFDCDLKVKRLHDQNLDRIGNCLTVRCELRLLAFHTMP